MRIEDLQPGTRFRMRALPHRRGVLLRLGPGSAVVRWDEVRHVRIRDGVEFDAHPGPVTISLATEVEPWSSR